MSAKRRSLEKIARLLSVRRSHRADTTPSAGARLRTSSRGARRAGTGIGRGDRGRTGTGSWSGVREQDPAGARTFEGIRTTPLSESQLSRFLVGFQGPDL